MHNYGTRISTHPCLEIIKTISVVIIAMCFIILVIQGFSTGTQEVYVRGGNIAVSGSVSVNNEVDVNIESVNESLLE